MPLGDREVLRISDAMRRKFGAPPDAIVAAIAARQDGVVSAAQLRLIGVPARGVSRRVSAGRLHPVLHGVHAVGHPAATERGRWQAALLAAGPSAALSHRAAAALAGLVPSPADPVDVTVPGATGRRRRGLRIHTGRLDRRDVVVRAGLRTTTVERAVLDLAEQLTVDRLVAVLDRAEAARVYRPRAMANVVARATGRRGLRNLRHALLVARPQDVLTRSELERRMLRLLARDRLPRPEVNVVLHGYEVDLLWRDRSLAVEVDGGAFHGDAIALDRDHRRDVELQARGLRVARFTWRQVVGDGAWVTARLRQLLAAT